MKQLYFFLKVLHINIYCCFIYIVAIIREFRTNSSCFFHFSKFTNESMWYHVHNTLAHFIFFFKLWNKQHKIKTEIQTNHNSFNDIAHHIRMVNHCHKFFWQFLWGKRIKKWESFYLSSNKMVNGSHSGCIYNNNLQKQSEKKCKLSPWTILRGILLSTSSRFCRCYST